MNRKGWKVNFFNQLSNLTTVKVEQFVVFKSVHKKSK